MSVVGFDVGNDSSCVALARKRGIDVLMNKESKRETPAVVSFGEKMRFMGTDGAAKFSLSPQNTAHQLKRILGKKFNDPELQADIARLPFAVSEAADGRCLITVQYCNERVSFTPEQLLAMILVDLKRIAEAEAGISVVDCCISVPTYSTEAERSAMLDAAKIAGLNCLRLINENTATALAYGIYKTDLPETDPVHVAFVDIGHSSTQVSVVALRRNGLQVKSHAWDRSLGGRNFDEILFDALCEEFKQKNKIDIKSNKKASFKLRQGIEKAKKILSANAEASLAVECIMEDTDVKTMLTREYLEQICAPVLERLKAPMEQALRESGVSIDDISSVEIVGSTTRMPAVFRLVEEVFKKVPSRTLNSKECVSRGAALQCAMLSPVFKVRDFEVIDAVPYAVGLRWDKDGEVASQVLFEKNSSFPSTKAISFFRSKPFKIEAYCPESGEKLSEYQIGPFEAPAGQEAPRIKVHVRMNLHGLVSVESVQLYEEQPEDVKMEEAAAPQANGAAAAATAPEGGAAPMETEAPAEAGPGQTAADAVVASAAARAAEKEKKKKVKRTDVSFQTKRVHGYPQNIIEELFEKECQMQAADRLQEETNERKNALEGYVYSMRNKLYDQYAPYVKDADKENLLAALQQMEDWLYDEGEDQTKSVYVAKLDELKKLGEPIALRYNEEQTRGDAVQSLRQAAEYYNSIATSDAPQYAHLEANERGQVIKECEAALTWLNDKVQQQQRLAKHDDPAFLTSEVTKKRETLDRVAKPIVFKPAPPAPKPASPAPQPAQEAQAQQGPQPMESDSAAQASEAAAGEEEAKPMDV